MVDFANQNYYIEDGKGFAFNALAMGEDLAKAMNALDGRGGWRVISSQITNYRRPVFVSRNNRHSIKVQAAYPNQLRGEASLVVTCRPTYTNHLPGLPLCGFNPSRSIEAIAKDILKKIEDQSEPIVDAWEAQIEQERDKASEHRDLLATLETITGKRMIGNGSGSRYFEIGPLSLRVNDNGTIQTQGYSSFTLEEIKMLADVFAAKTEVAA